MKKPLLFALALGWILTGKAQVISENAVIIDAAEDTTQVTTINDIVVMQERVTSRNITDAHYANVWGRKSFFNPGFVISNVSSRKPVWLNNKDQQELKFRHDWGAQIELGHSYTLHRGAIANMVQINLDYTFIDLTVNHYKQDDAFSAFKPGQKWDERPGHEADYNPSDGSEVPDDEKTYTNGFEYLPWGADKYDLTYGMSIGPSVTLAPFTPLNNKGLDFIRLNAYYHLGYNVGLLLMDQKSSARGESKGSGLSFDYLSWGYGWSHTFGLSVSWKSIGIGWETRSANLYYKPMSTGDYGKIGTRLINSSNRIYLTIKY